MRGFTLFALWINILAAVFQLVTMDSPLGLLLFLINVGCAGWMWVLLKSLPE